MAQKTDFLDMQMEKRRSDDNSEVWDGPWLTARGKEKTLVHTACSSSIAFSASFSLLYETYEPKECSCFVAQSEVAKRTRAEEVGKTILVKQLAQEKKDNVRLTTKIQTLQEQLLSVHSELASSRKILSETINQSKDIETQRDQAYSDVMKLRSELHVIRVKLHSSEERVKTCEEPLLEQLHSTEKGLQKANAALAKMKANAARIQPPSDFQVRNLRSQIATLKEEKSDLKQELSNSKLTLRNSQNSARTLEERKETLETSLQRIKERQNNTQTQLESLQKEKNRLSKQFQTTTNAYDTIVEEKKKLEQKTRSMRCEIANTEAELEVLSKEKKRWWLRLAVAQGQLNSARNQLASLDFSTRTQLDVHQEIILSPIKRGNIDLSKAPPSDEIAHALQELNGLILERSKTVVQVLEKDRSVSVVESMSNIPIERMEPILGETITTMLRRRKKPSSGFMTIVIQVLFVHWCPAIIQAWYPKRRSFADLLISLSSGIKVENDRELSNNDTLVIHVPMAKRSHFSNWEEDIIIDIYDILTLGKFSIASPFNLSDRFISMIKAAHNLRTALAERDACGGLELLTVVPGTLYQPKTMQVPSENRTVAFSSNNEPPTVAGNVGLGLHTVQKSSAGHVQGIPGVVLKPQVILKHSIEAL